MSTVDDLRNDLAAIRAHFELRFDQMKIEMNQLKMEMKIEASQLKAEIKTEIKMEIGQLNRRMDVLAGMVEQGRQQQQDPVDGAGEGQVNQDPVDGAINNVGDRAQDDQEDEGDHQDSVSVKSEIESGSCQSDCDYWLNEEDIKVKVEEVAEDHGAGGQQHEDQAPIEPVAGPSGISREALKRPQTNPPRRSTRQTTSRLNLAESSDSDEEEETDWEPPSPPTKKARTSTSSGRKTHRCPQCSKMVTRLAQHLLTHTGERPYPCQHANCGQAFTQKCHLNDHLLRRHSGVKRYHCEPCKKRFATNSDLVSHRRYVHSHERPHRCPRPGCNYAAVQKCDLKIHLQSKKHQLQ